MPFRVKHPYAPRPTRFRGVVEYEGYRMKRYTLTLPGEPFDDARFQSGRGLALSAVPEPAVTDERPGVGFVIEHQGRGMDYVTVAWWDRENELSLRIIVGDDAGWRPARSESICVWDLEVLKAERDLYAEAVLGGARANVEAYLARAMPDVA
jgi:hypothetical protein